MSKIAAVLAESAKAAINSLQFAAIRHRRRSYRPQLPESPISIPEKVFRDAQCCFVLSTGRCGTAFLTRLLAKDPRLDVQHQPKPSLLYASKLAYLGGESGAKDRISGAIHARFELVRDSYLTGGIFVETNNRVTFFGAEIAELFRRSSFIHLVRHPAAFTRSGLLRNYFTGGSGDEGRITPRTEDPAYDAWATMADVERIGWLWNATNSDIERVKATIEQERVLTVRAEDLFSEADQTVRIYEFLGRPPPSMSSIRSILARPVNAQRDHDGRVPRWEHWPQHWRRELAAQVQLASRYGYDL